MAVVNQVLQSSALGLILKDNVGTWRSYRYPRICAQSMMIHSGESWKHQKVADMQTVGGFQREQASVRSPIMVILLCSGKRKINILKIYCVLPTSWKLKWDQMKKMDWSIRKRKLPNNSQTTARWLLADFCCVYNESVQGGEQEASENM